MAPIRGSWASLALIGVMANAAAAFSPTTGTFILPQALHSAGALCAAPLCSASAATQCWGGRAAVSQDARVQLAAPLRRCRSATLGPVMMGRAAAVRANKKGKTDMIKAKLNARFGKMVVAAVKSGGADPVANTALAKILDQGKKAGVPKDNMEKAMKRGASKDQADYKESTFEAYAHGGVGFVIDVLTDNNNRAAGDIRTVINKQKLKQAESGSVAFNFDRLGAVTVITDKDEDEMTEAAVEAGAEDLEPLEDSEDGAGYLVFTDTKELAQVADAIEEAGFKVTESKFVWKPKAPVEISDEDVALNLAAIEALEELDDVDSVHTNMA